MESSINIHKVFFPVQLNYLTNQNIFTLYCIHSKYFEFRTNIEMIKTLFYIILYLVSYMTNIYMIKTLVIHIYKFTLICMPFIYKIKHQFI